MKVNIINGRKQSSFSNNTKLLVDIYRSTTTMPMMLNAGATEIIPTDSISKARDIKKDHPEYVIAGERYGFKIPGFEMSNSPYEVSKSDLKGKTVVFTSTNGTKVLKKISNGCKVFICSYVNFTPTLEWIKDEKEIDVVLSGRPDGKADEDYFFGEFVKKLLEERVDDYEKFVGLTKKGQGTKRLKLIGAGRDIPFCLDKDKVPFAVTFANQKIVRMNVE